MKKDITLTIILSLLIIIGAALIIAFRNSPAGKTILDSLAMITGILQTIIGIVVFKAVKKSYLKMLIFIIILIGIVTFIIHVMRIAPVETWKILGLR